MSSFSSRFVGGFCRTRQNDPKFGELAEPRIDLYRPAMLLDDDVMTNGQAEPSPFTSRFCRKERVEQFLPRFGWDAGAVVAYPDFDALAQIFGRGSKRRFVATVCFGLTLRCRVETIGDQVEQRP